MNNLVRGRAGISAEMAIRLDKAFGGGAETWLRLQAAYDLSQAEKKSDKIKVGRVGQAEAVPASSLPLRRNGLTDRQHA